MVRKIVALILVAVFGLSFAAPALARNDDRDDGGSRGKRIQSRFDDWATDFWANESLARMITKGVIKGNGDGTITAARAVTRLEAAIMLSRLLNLEEPQLGYGELKLEASWGELKIKNERGKFEIKIEAKGQGEFKFKDSDDVPSWGRGAILTALQEGFLIFDGASLSPMAPLNRLEAAIMLVKAAKLDAEAVARAGADLPFTDAERIPDRLTGYIAVAIENGFVTGYDDGSFRPQKLVTRAEWAALLDRLDRKGPAVSPDGRQVKGTVTGVNIGSSPSVSMTTPVFPGGVTYPVDDTALFYAGGKEITIAGIAVGDQVIVNLSTDRKILMVTVHNVPRQVSGTVTAYTAPTATAAGSLTLASGTGTPSTYVIPAAVTVSLNGRAATAADILIGDDVTLSLEGASVKRIAIKAQPKTVTGILTAVTAGTGGSLPSLTVRASDNTTFSYSVADHATLTSSGGAALTMADLKAGDAVTLKVERNLIVRITVTSNASVRTVSGTVSAYAAPSGSAAGSLTLAAADGTARTYAITAAATVTLGTGTATLADIRVGDQVTLTLENEQVKAIAIQVQSSTVTGTLAAAVPGVNGAPATLAVIGQNSAVSTYTLASQATIRTSNGTSLSFADLKAGDAVTLRVERNLVVDVTVTRWVRAVSGTVSAYAAPSGSAAGSLTLAAADGTARTYAISAAATVTLGTGTATLADIRLGDQVTLTLENELVKAIAIQVQSSTVTGTLAAAVPGANGGAATLAVIGQNNAVAIYTMASQAAITTSNGTSLSFADLKAGDAVTLRVERNLVVSVTVARVLSTVSGTVSAYAAPSAGAAGSITLTPASGTATTYAVMAGAAVTVGTGTATLADILVGDTATMTLDGDLVTRVAIHVETLTVTGTLAGVTPAAGSAAATVTLTVNGVQATYPAATQVVVTDSTGAALTMSDLQVGDEVSLVVRRNQVVQITISEESASEESP